MNSKRWMLVSGLAAAAIAIGAVLTVQASGGGGGDEEREGRNKGGEGWEAVAGWPQTGAEDGAHLAVYRQECGECHVAYPPQLLDPAQWQSLLLKLDDHFGDSATPTAGNLAAVSRYLTTHAARPGATMMRTGFDTPRITNSAWFIDEHDEVPESAWQRASVGSSANCAACHRGAEEGRYDEDSVRIPR